jgi:hypothetical protein
MVQANSLLDGSGRGFTQGKQEDKAMAATLNVASETPKTVAGRRISYGWLILGFFLSPILVLLVWANYQLLGLGLEAVFGLNRIEWVAFGRIVSIQDLIATAMVASELLAGFLFAELAGWINLLDLDEHLQTLQRRMLKWVSFLLFLSLVAGEVGIALYRQNVIDKQAQEYSEKLRELSAPVSSHPIVDRRGEVDLTKSSSERTEKPSSPTKQLSGKQTNSARNGWGSFIDSMPFAATIFIHITIPCLTAAIGVIMSPLTFFSCGVGFTLVSVIPLSFSCVGLDLTSRVLQGLRSIVGAILNLVAAPARILVEGFIRWRS